jgi:serine/threonine-protein kinase
VPPAVERATERALAKVPADRFRSAEEFAEALISDDTPEALQKGPGATGSGRPKRRSVLIGAAIALLIGSATIGGIMRFAPQLFAPASYESNRLAVLPFSYRGGEEHAYLAEGMVDMLSKTLDGAGDLSTIEPSAVFGIVGQEGGGESLEQRRAVVGRLNAGHYVVGDIVEAGGALRISARLYVVSDGSEPEMEATVEGAADDVFGLVDKLSAALLVSNTDNRAERLTRVAAVTTESLEALKAFLEGESAYRAYDNIGSFSHFRRAVEIDSSFAMAWFRLSVLGEQWAQSTLALEAAERALRHGDRLSPRDRLHMEAQYARARGAAPEAERVYRDILERHPDDVEAWRLLGSLLSEYGPLLPGSQAEAPEATERVLRYDPDNERAKFYMMVFAVQQGDRARADSLLAEWFQGNEIAFPFRAIRDIGVGTAAERERLMAVAAEQDAWNLFVASFFVGSFVENVSVALELAQLGEERAKSPEWRALLTLRTALLEASLGRWRGAQVELERLAELSPNWAIEYRALWSLQFRSLTRAELVALRDSLSSWDPVTSRLLIVEPESDWRTGPSPTVARYYLFAHNDVNGHVRSYLLGRLSARLDEYDAALRHAEELERMEAPATAGTISRDLAQAVRAHIFWSRGDTARALAALEAAPREVPRQRLWTSPFFAEPQERFLLAELLEARGRDDEALAWYGTFGVPSVYDVFHLAPSYFRRAQIYERLGKLEEARHHYARFVELWQDADPELQPQVEAARRALQALTPDAAGSL